MSFDLSNYLDVSNLKQIVTKVTNAVMNYTEFQAKVMEATNNEPWGASSTLMQEIAAGTNHPTYFMEIMEVLYKKLQERGANWRQCYKALQLLEYLIKNGSERVVDNARDHIYELKSLKSFFYVDEKGKDQGINVKNRANEIVELLNDNQKIRDERKKAVENRSKYTGVSSNSFSSGSFSSGGFGGSGKKYGGFGSDSYRSGGGGFRDDPEPSSSSYKKEEVVVKKVEKKEEKKEIPNLLDMGTESKDDDWGEFTAASPTTATKSGLDDFAGFQSAPSPINAAAKPIQNFAAPDQGGFAAFSAGVSQAGFAAFPAPTTNNNAGFNPNNIAFNNNAVANKPSIPPSNSMGMTSPTMGFNNGFNNNTGFSNNNASFNAGYNNNSGFNNNPGFNAGFNNNNNIGFQPVGPQQQPAQQPTSFGSFPSNTAKPQNVSGMQTSPTNTKPDDPFSKLVDLNANSLFGSGKKPAANTGPCLNVISNQQAQQNFNQMGKPKTTNAQVQGNANDFTLI